jgi:hypothetical protein
VQAVLNAWPRKDDDATAPGEVAGEESMPE